MTKEDLDAEFPNSSPIHRRALYSRIQDLKNPHRVARNLKEDAKGDAKYEPKPASYFKDYHGTISCGLLLISSPPHSEL